MDPSNNYWPHAPRHSFEDAGTYFVTAACYQHNHFFTKPDALDFLQDKMFEIGDSYGWMLQGWSLFSNHYHLIADSPSSGGKSLREWITRLHTDSSRFVNRMDGVKGRKVWHNYWDKQLSFKRSYFSRLNYVMDNPVHHGLVHDARQYPWCSAKWFDTHAKASFKEAVRSFKTSELRVSDDYTPVNPFES